MGEKKVSGRKRHILVDTEGNLLVVIAHAANIQDRDGADWVLEAAVATHERLSHIWADSGYRGDLVDYWESEHGITIEIVSKQPGGPAHMTGNVFGKMRLGALPDLAHNRVPRRLPMHDEAVVAEVDVHLGELSAVRVALHRPDSA